MKNLSIIRFADFIAQVKPGVRFYPILFVYILKLLMMTPFEILESMIFDQKVSEHEIKDDPIFILGYWRSGTTYLHRLFIQNSDLAYLNFYESFFPKTYLLTEAILSPLVQGLLSLFRYQHPAHRVPLNVSFPFEEDIALALSFDESAFSLAHIAPGFFDQYFEKFVRLKDEKTKEGFKNSYLQFVKKLSYRHGGKQLVLKTPANYGRISTLLEMYPKAKFVVIQRNPYEVFPSNVGFWKTLRPHALQEISDEFIEKNVFETYVKMNELYLAQVGMIPESQLIQIKYEELKQDPLEVMNGIYRKFNLSQSPESLPRLQEFIRKNHNTACIEHDRANGMNGKISTHWKKQIEVLGYETI